VVDALVESSRRDGWRKIGPFASEAFIFEFFLSVFIFSIFLMVISFPGQSDNWFSEDLTLILPPILVLLFGLLVYSSLGYWSLTKNSINCIILSNWTRTRDKLIDILEMNGTAYEKKTFNRLWLATSDINEILVLEDSHLWILIKGRDSRDSSIIYMKGQQEADEDTRQKIQGLIENELPFKKTQ